METLYQLLQLFLYLNNILSYYYLNLIDDVSPDILDVRKPKLELAELQGTCYIK